MSSPDPTASAPDPVAEGVAPAAARSDVGEPASAPSCADGAPAPAREEAASADLGPDAARPRRIRRGRLVALAVIASAVALVAALAAGRGGGGSDARASGTSVASQAAAAAKTTGSTAAADAQAGSTTAEGEVDPLAPLPESRAKVVSPVAGEATEDAETGASSSNAADPQDDLSLPKPKGPATKTSRSQTKAPVVRNLSVDKATALPNGVALPPLEAPEAVLQVIRAGNTIARTPYKWGGGHGSFQDNGYDCSGSVSFALFSAGLIEGSRTSGGLMSWGQPGKGRWITVYANGGHTFMEVAGIRFDTSGRQVTGSRWQNEFRSTAGFVARHPAGL